MFGRYNGDWNDEENIRTYLLTDRNYGDPSKCRFQREVEALPSEMKNEMWDFMADTGVEVVYCFELVEQGQMVPDEEDCPEVYDFLLIEDIR